MLFKTFLWSCEHLYVKQGIPTVTSGILADLPQHLTEIKRGLETAAMRS